MATVTDLQLPTSPPRTKATAFEPSPAFSPLRGPADGSAPPEGFDLAGGSATMSKEMHLAVNSGDVETVTKLLAEEEDTAARTKFGETALHRAVRTGTVEAVEALLAATPDLQEMLDSPDESGKTPLITVCGTKKKAYGPGHLKIVQKLLEVGSDPNAVDLKQHSSIGRAAAAGHVNIVLLLLKAGVAMDTADLDGKTPLIHAAAGKHNKIVELLLKADKASQYRKHPIATVNVKDKDGKTPLMYACLSRRMEMVTLLLSHKADSFAEDNQGKNALKYCKKAPDCEAKIEGAQSKATGGSGKKKK